LGIDVYTTNHNTILK
jgi:hypothetical protein